MVTDPESPYFMFDTVSESAAETGHGYVAPDRVGGNIQSSWIASGKPPMLLVEEWMEHARKANREHPNKVYRFDQKMHRLFVKRTQDEGATAAAELGHNPGGFLDQIYRESAPTLHSDLRDPDKAGGQTGWWGWRKGQPERFALDQFQFREFGVSVYVLVSPATLQRHATMLLTSRTNCRSDDDGQTVCHPGEMWCREKSHDVEIQREAVVKVPWMKVDLRRRTGRGANAKPVSWADDGVELDIMAADFDVYDGLRPQPPAKDHDAERLSRFFLCACDQPGQCAPRTRGEPCVQYAKKHRYPPVANEAERQRLEEAYVAEGGHVDAVERAELDMREARYDGDAIGNLRRRHGIEEEVAASQAVAQRGADRYSRMAAVAGRRGVAAEGEWEARDYRPRKRPRYTHA